MLVVLLRKQTITQKLPKLKKLTGHNHGKYITTSEFNTLAADVFNAGLSRANLITKTDFDATLSSLNKKITKNKTKHLLVENELKKLKTFDASYFIGKSHFEEDGTQNYLVFQPIRRYFKLIAIHYILLYGNLNDYLLKLLSLLLRLIIVLLRYLIMSVTK